MNEIAENVVDMEEKQEDWTTAEIREAFSNGVEADKEEDSVLIDMIQAGCTFSAARRTYNRLMVEAGLALSKEDKDEIVSTAVGENDISTEEGFDAAVAYVDEAAESISFNTAGNLIRAYAKKNEIEVFKKPRGSGTRTTFLTHFYNALIENPNMTEEEAHQFIVDKGGKNTL